MLSCLRQPGFPGTFLSGLIWWVVSRGPRLGLQVQALEQTYLKNPAGIRIPRISALSSLEEGFTEACGEWAG